MVSLDKEQSKKKKTSFKKDEESGINKKKAHAKKTNEKKKPKDKEVPEKKKTDEKKPAPKKREISAWSTKTPHNVLVPKYMKSIVAENGEDVLEQNGKEKEAGIKGTAISKEAWLKKYAIKWGRSWYYVGPYLVADESGKPKKMRENKPKKQ